MSFYLVGVLLRLRSRAVLYYFSVEGVDGILVCWANISKQDWERLLGEDFSTLIKDDFFNFSFKPSLLSVQNVILQRTVNNLSHVFLTSGPMLWFFCAVSSFSGSVVEFSLSTKTVGRQIMECIPAFFYLKRLWVNNHSWHFSECICQQSRCAKGILTLPRVLILNDVSSMYLNQCGGSVPGKDVRAVFNSFLIQIDHYDGHWWSHDTAMCLPVEFLLFCCQLGSFKHVGSCFSLFLANSGAFVVGMQVKRHITLKEVHPEKNCLCVCLLIQFQSPLLPISS